MTPTGSVSHATAQGPRPSQEDRWVAVRLEGPRAGWLLAVMDGHGGAETSGYLAEHLEEVFREHLNAGHGAREALRSAVAVLAERTGGMGAGSSLSVAFVPEDAAEAQVAVLGDSPVAFRDASGEVGLGPVHNVQIDLDGRDAAVAKGAEHMGGYLVDARTGDGVALTRALGDSALEFLDRAPEVFGVELGSGSFVVVASDGVFTTAAPSPGRLGEYLRERIDAGADAEALVNDALAQGTDDNITVVVWRAGS